MIKHFLYLITFIATCFPAKPGNAQVFTVTNRLDIARKAEVVSIQVKDLLKKVPRDKISQIQIRQKDGKDYLLTQQVDNNLDGKTDEILFLASLGPKQTETFFIETKTVSQTAKSGLTTFSRFVPERQNDYAWENDRVAFRIYGTAAGRVSVRPTGGGVDAFMKRVSYPIIDRWYKNNAEKEGAYHIDTGEGHDPYLIGDSRGIGGIGIWDRDTLYTSANFISSKTIAVGPLRTIFELTFAPWEANGRTIKEIKRVSLDLGSNLSRVTEIINFDKPLPGITAGISLNDKKGQVKVNEKEGWYRYWEPLNDSWLGTAIVAVPESVSSFKDYRTKAKNQSHLLVFTKLTGNESTFYAGYAWGKSGHFKTADEWDKYLSDFSKKLASPLIPKFK
ncbi:MAG: DUF4861 family protein [Daejeonella sp.]|uniref:DUF4861 family protein n=1 Tax=Daejeonella sp. JGW-45 TaxID=3034148 RepID=UPI0023EB5470|nr:DUF4861 family protein [Daejeonella sp. JGW-45]